MPIRDELQYCHRIIIKIFEFYMMWIISPLNMLIILFIQVSNKELI